MSDTAVPQVDINAPLPDSRTIEEVKDTVMINAKKQYYFGITMLFVFLAVFATVGWGYTQLNNQTPITNNQTIVVASPSPVATPVSEVKPVFAVWNGSGVAGAAGKMAEKLKTAGYEVVETKNAPDEQTGTSVEITRELLGQQESILQIVGVKDGTAKPGLGANLEYNVLVVIGK